MFIHIGKGKTATTLLQNEIYIKNKDINYIAKTNSYYPDWLIQWHYADDIHFKSIKREIYNKYSLEVDNNKINVISSEAFSIVGNLYQQARRIYEITPNAKIIMTLRDPIDAILSFYKYNISEGINCSTLEESIDWTRTPMVYYKRKLIYLPDFYYNEIIDIYNDLFGESNVCILKYEDMNNNPDKFFKELSVFMDIRLDIEDIKKKLQIKVNSSPNENSVDSIRAKNLFNNLLSEFPDSNIKLEDIKITQNELMSDELKQQIIENIKGKCFGYY